MKLVLASGNAGKLKELQAMLAGLPLEIVAQGALGVSDVPETGLTFVENALIKAGVIDEDLPEDLRKMIER